MGRLTERNKNGNPYYPFCFREDGCYGKGSSKKCNGCNFAEKVIDKLSAYEDIIDEPEKLKEMDVLYLERCEEINRLNAEQAEYKRLGDEGLLLRLPCKVGDILWHYEGRMREPMSCTVKEFVIRKYCFDRVEIYFEDCEGFTVCNFKGNLDEGCYLTREEAEKALKKLEEQNGEN